MAYPPYGTAQIRTPIEYQDLYTPQDTAAAGNQASADYSALANPRFAAKGFRMPGVRRSASTFAAAMPQIGANQVAAALAPIQQKAQDDYANAQHLNQVQQAQFGDVMGQLGNVTRLQNPFGQNILSQIMALLNGG